MSSAYANLMLSNTCKHWVDGRVMWGRMDGVARATSAAGFVDQTM